MSLLLTSRLMAFTALSGLVFNAVPALAQSAQAPITEIIVTAQKRPEPLSRTPLAMAVVSGEQMEKAGAHDLRDLQNLTPSLFVIADANEAQTTARLRGVGTVGDNPGLDSSVGVVIDGVSRARTATAMSDLGPLDRIEILKGPQSDVYGKGASAGVIQVVSKRPSFTPEADVTLDAGTMGAYGASLYTTGKISDHWAGSLFLTKRQRDGQYHVHTGDGPATRKDDADQNYGSGRGQLLYVPNDRASVRLIADYTNRDEACCAAVGLNVGPTAAYINQLAGGDGTAMTADPKARQVWSNRPLNQTITDEGVSAQVDLKLTDHVQLTSITAVRRWTDKNGYDGDFTAADILYRDIGGLQNQFDTVSQEIRFNGTGDRLNWMAGVYIDQNDLSRHDETLYGSDYEAYLSLLLSGGTDPAKVSGYTGLPVGQSFVAGQGSHDVYEQRDKNVALFGHADWKLTNSLTLLGGLRWNHQDKFLTSRFSNSDGGKACSLATGGLSVLCLPWSNPAYNGLVLFQRNAEDATTGSLRLKWQATPTLMTYVSYATGWKGTGYNLDREQNPDDTVDRDSSFKPETSRSYEIGAKGRWLANRLSLNLAAFDEAFNNFQLNTYLGTTFVVDSVPHLRSKGVELDGLYYMGDLTLNGGVTYDEARFGSEAVPGLPLIANGTASFAPKWSAAYGADYSHPIGDLRLGITVSAKYNSAYNTGSDLNPVKEQKAYTLVGGRIALSSPDDGWSLELWGQNLTNVTYEQVAFAAPFQSGTYDAFLGLPRTWGLTLRLQY
ncbi:TonB-dependent receptor [Asticcacaulis sp. EMRT-3]|uniref:TonB-dependent receptor n=1 Tax=Asticcacaulis sp. EMRT-3 TaxID=3040349 RepID=UPI0024AFFD21|nr:TonB-dependent receptor [Asticcacaulis sp. EMRT-3]MDI7775898.1 TonB-dependent receptor [Asticcacaulis sp. EMRT-3]